MNIIKKQDDTKLTIALEGRLDTSTAPELEKELLLENVTDLTFEFSGLQYISSAGLRVILRAQKKMDMLHGSMTVRNLNDMIAEVFDATGFSDIITIEKD